ncbi:putative O-methylsterigmatocystin oxidoreductase [Cyathus striatus]|nr:putative O-methylsterigmatocystin oxidoreductase [Cyathus striatus]
MPCALYYLVLCLATITVLIWSRRIRARPPYPPGPPADPIIGHLRVMPQGNQETVFRDWSKIYGDIIYLHIPGRSFLVLNSLKVATEILDQRSGIYSDRMRLILFELMGWTRTLSMLPYGKRFQKHRRLLQEYLNQKQCLTYQPLQTQLARRLLVRLVDNPQDWRSHFERFSTEIIVKIAYGMDIISDDDPYIDISATALHSLSSCGSLGSTPVDFIPLLKYFPSWFPGTYYAFKARSFYPAVRKMHEYPFEAVMRQLKEGTAQPSYLSYHLEQLHGKYHHPDHMADLQGSAGVMYGGGAETTYCVLSHYIHAMVLYPECQKRGQHEIDQVIGKHRLPELSDRSSLPYVEGILQEVLRWNTATPSGIPHRSIADDVYNGTFIPKGTVIIANVFAILRDESIYADPDSFNPSRYLPKPEGNAEPYPVGHFGFGRRICPGLYLADASLWITIASMLATLEVGRVLDDKGMEIIPDGELITGGTSQPKPFPCTIRPRDRQSEGVIRQAQLWNDH